MALVYLSSIAHAVLAGGALLAALVSGKAAEGLEERSLPDALTSLHLHDTANDKSPDWYPP